MMGFPPWYAWLLPLVVDNVREAAIAIASVLRTIFRAKSRNRVR